MEFPHLGQHCSEPTCKQLDFLPMKCDACSKIFCDSHFTYEKHHCPESYKKDNQVPVCPLCNTPIPVNRGEPPDVKVSAHIDNDCQSDPAKEKRKRIYTNKCTAKGCKTKELIPFSCEKCQQNYCVRHRLEADHDCKGFGGTGRAGTPAGAAAVKRVEAASKPASTKSHPQQTVLSSVGRDLDRERRQRAQQATTRPAPRNLRAMQANMTEDEALAQAMTLSLSDRSTPAPDPTHQSEAQAQQEAEDLALAQAIAESERETSQHRNRGSQSHKKDTCCIA